MARSLPSYLDQNFHIHAEDGDYILKVAHPSWARKDLDLENRAMMALAAREPDIQWPRVQLTPAGEHLLCLPVAARQCHVRVLSFVPGSTYAEVMANGLPRAACRRLQEDLGVTVARLGRGLREFRHPAATREHPWNLQRLPALCDEVAHIGDRALRDAVERQIQTFCRSLPEWRKSLPQSVVHNDANDHNVIVAADADGVWQVRSVIDFGDLCTSWRVAELAIACAYAMPHDDDPVACARAVLRGYLTHSTLTRAELAALPILIGARACQSILMATRAQREQPDNTYIQVSQQGMRHLLQNLAEITPGAVFTPFLETAHD